MYISLPELSSHSLSSQIYTLLHTPRMGIYEGITPKGYMSMLAASLGAILFVSPYLELDPSPRSLLTVQRGLTMDGGVQYLDRKPSSAHMVPPQPSKVSTLAFSPLRNNPSVPVSARQESWSVVLSPCMSMVNSVERCQCTLRLSSPSLDVSSK